MRLFFVNFLELTYSGINAVGFRIERFAAKRGRAILGEC